MFEILASNGDAATSECEESAILAAYQLQRDVWNEWAGGVKLPSIAIYFCEPDEETQLVLVITEEIKWDEAHR